MVRASLCPFWCPPIENLDDFVFPFMVLCLFETFVYVFNRLFFFAKNMGLWSMEYSLGILAKEVRKFHTMRLFPLSSSSSSSSSSEREQNSEKKSGSMIYLNVYDLTTINNYLYLFGLGIFHSGIEGMAFSWYSELVINFCFLFSSCLLLFFLAIVESVNVLPKLAGS